MHDVGKIRYATMSDWRCTVKRILLMKVISIEQLTIGQTLNVEELVLPEFFYHFQCILDTFGPNCPS